MTTVGSLCSGYGGLDLGLALALGVELDHLWHVEYDAAPSKILARHWPDVPNLGDLTTLNHDALPTPDWLTAGYPCQPFSSAGKRKGASDERHLWPYVAAAIGALRPRGVVLENVAGHVSLGLDAVLWELAALGYDARWGVVRASDAGAPHGRARIFVLAYAQGDTWRLGHGDGVPARDTPGSRRHAPAHAEGRHEPAGTPGGSGVAAPDAPSAARRGQELSGVGPSARSAAEPGERPRATAWGRYELAIRRWERVLGRPAPAPIDAERRLSPRFVEWMQGLSDGWVTDVLDPSPARKALGNGVVPQQAALALRLLGVTRQEIAA